MLHNETATGALSPIAEIRKAIDRAGHPALFMVDTISSLASTDYRHDEWGVDVSVGGAQKGLMLPPGMSFNALSDKAIAASAKSNLPKSFFSWEDMLNMNKIGFFPYTPATNMLQGLVVAVDMLHEEGLDNVFARHERHAEATRRAIKAWGLEILCREPKHYSPTITAVLLPEGHDADAFRDLALQTFDISYGMSFGKFAGKFFRIGHLGDTNDLTILGALAATEMSLSLANIPHKKGGVQAAMDYIVSAHGKSRAQGGGVSPRHRDGQILSSAIDPGPSMTGPDSFSGAPGMTHPSHRVQLDILPTPIPAQFHDFSPHCEGRPDNYAANVNLSGCWPL